MILRLGIIGTSWWVERAYLPGARLARGIEVIALCGRNPERLRKLTQQFNGIMAFRSPEEMLLQDDIDAVAIVLPNFLHYRYTRAALEAGKAVLCEKPVGLDAREARSLYRLASDRSLGGMVPFTWCFTAAARYVKDLLEQGYLGDLYSATGCYLSSWLLDGTASASWRTRQRESGTGAIGDLGSHLVALVHFLSGKRIERVTASLRTFHSERMSAETGTHEVVDVEDSCQFLAGFEGGAHGSFHVDRAAAGTENLVKVTLRGSEGALQFLLEVDDYGWPHGSVFGIRLAAGDTKLRRLDIPDVYLNSYPDPLQRPGVEVVFAALLDEFASAARERRSNGTCGLQTAAQVQGVLDAVAGSGRLGSWAEVDIQPLHISLGES